MLLAIQIIGGAFAALAVVSALGLLSKISIQLAVIANSVRGNTAELRRQFDLQVEEAKEADRRRAAVIQQMREHAEDLVRKRTDAHSLQTKSDPTIQ